MTKKKYIEIYNTVYDIDIVIANKNVTLKDLQKKYSYADETELNEDLTASIATTARCKTKSTNKYCIIIKYNNHQTCKDL